LFLLSKEKNYCIYIGGLAKILDWSTEFYYQHYDNIITWKSYMERSDTTDKTIALDELIVAFGNERIKHFFEKKITLLLILSKNMQPLK
jgi:hypothetical protein